MIGMERLPGRLGVHRLDEVAILVRGDTLEVLSQLLWELKVSRVSLLQAAQQRREHRLARLTLLG